MKGVLPGQAHGRVVSLALIAAVQLEPDDAADQQTPREHADFDQHIARR
jgi:hypothetical protein